MPWVRPIDVAGKRWSLLDDIAVYESPSLGVELESECEQGRAMTQASPKVYTRAAPAESLLIIVNKSCGLECKTGA